MTDWNEDLTLAFSGFSSATFRKRSFIELTSFSTKINGPIDDIELHVAAGLTDFTQDLARRGRFANAKVHLGYVLADDLTSDTLLFVYDVGEARVEGNLIIFELFGPEKRLEQPVGRVLSAGCPFAFGDRDCGIRTQASEWNFSTAYGANTIVRPRSSSSPAIYDARYWFRAQNAGTSAAPSPVGEPTWPTTVGNTVNDGASPQIVWECIRALRFVGTVTSVSSRSTFTASALSFPEDWFGEGFLTWQTGDNSGDKRRIKSHTAAGVITLQIPSYDDIQVGDTFEAVAGCRKRLTEDCITKHDNESNSYTQTLRYGGHPFLADESITFSAKKR